MRRTTLSLLSTAVLLVLGALGLATPATAHEGPGVLTVEADHPTATGHHFVIRLVWQNDGHPAARDTTLTATPYTPDGAPQTPIAMTPVDDDGRFEAAVDMAEPGSWRVQFASVNPVATVDQPVDVAAPTTTTTAAATTTEEPAASTGGDPTASRTSDEDDDSSGGAIALVLVAVAVIGAAIAIAGYSILRRRSHTASDTSSTASDATPTNTEP